jgi:hypothetical protein
MPRKPAIVMSRVIDLNIGTLTLNITGNPLMFDSRQRALLSHVLTDLDVLEQVAKGDVEEAGPSRT